MGISFSSNRRRNNNYYHQNPPSQLISSSSYPPVDPSYSTPPYIYSNPPPPPPPQPQPHPQPQPRSPSGLPPPTPPSGLPPPTPPVYLPYDGSNYSNNALIVRPNFVPYNHHPQGNYSYGWMPPPMRPPPVVPAPPTYVDHQQAKKVKNHVNVHKDTLTVVVDEENPDCHLVSFVFDAMFDGSITIYYFGKEESDCKFNPVYAEAFVPVKVPFQKGIGQRFRQPSGTGIDLGFFELDALSKPSIGEDVFPLVICAETTLPLFPTDEHLYDLLPSIATGPHMQITQAVLEKNNNGDGFKVRVMRQILWIDGVRYELREIYGIGQSAESFNDTASGAECVICMTEPKDTAVLPCRHMCLCSECAKALRLQSNKCPICRQPIEELMEIKINTVDQ